MGNTNLGWKTYPINNLNEVFSVEIQVKHVMIAVDTDIEE